MIPATPQQARCLKVIRHHQDTHGTPPSYSEIQGAMELPSKAQVHQLLTRMKDRGLIDFGYGRARSIRIIGEVEGLEARSTPDLLRLRENIDAILVGRS
jgi:SOS-response transcriptional repressor LexA